MRWTPKGRSSNLEDRRGVGGAAKLGVGGTVVVLVLSLVFGRNLFTDLGVQPAMQGGESAPLSAQDSAREEQQVQFVSFVLDDAQQTWSRLFQQGGQPYHDAKLVLFRNAVQSGCGSAQSAMGPFYCPADQKVYIDLGFYDQLRDQLGADGDFAEAYVLAHEIGHHIQTLLGTNGEIHRLQQSQPSRANQLSVMLELQADCYAGIWAHSTQQRELLEKGDIEEGLNAAASVGDDRIQQQSGGSVDVESFTHGSAQQRSFWFRKGLQSGDPNACNTFAGA